MTVTTLWYGCSAEFFYKLLLCFGRHVPSIWFKSTPFKCHITWQIPWWVPMPSGARFHFFASPLYRLLYSKWLFLKASPKHPSQLFNSVGPILFTKCIKHEGVLQSLRPQKNIEVGIGQLPLVKSAVMDCTWAWSWRYRLVSHRMLSLSAHRLPSHSIPKVHTETIYGAGIWSDGSSSILRQTWFVKSLYYVVIHHNVVILYFAIYIRNINFVLCRHWGCDIFFVKKVFLKGTKSNTSYLQYSKT